jgi:tetratricopeptide (TPR) repeat protein
VHLAFGALFVISSAAILLVRRHASLFVGWFWFLGTLVPVLGLVQVGRQLMADRYVYLPMLGLGLALAWLLPTGASGVSARPWIRPTLAALATASVLALAVRTSGELGYWHDSIRLYTRALEVTRGDNCMASFNLAIALQEKGDKERSLDEFTRAINRCPNLDPEHSLGPMLGEAGRLEAALPHLLAAVRDAPASAASYYNLGQALWRMGRVAEATPLFERALSLDPEHEDAREMLREIRRPSATAVP